MKLANIMRRTIDNTRRTVNTIPIFKQLGSLTFKDSPRKQIPRGFKDSLYPEKKQLIFGGNVTMRGVAANLRKDGFEAVTFKQWQSSEVNEKVFSVITEQVGYAPHWNSRRWQAGFSVGRKNDKNKQKMPLGNINAGVKDFIREEAIPIEYGRLDKVKINSNGHHEFTFQTTDKTVTTTTEDCFPNLCIGNKYTIKNNNFPFCSTEDIFKKPEEDLTKFFKGKHIVVIGGGATTVEMCEKALEFGAHKLTVIAKHGLAPTMPDAMGYQIGKEALTASSVVTKVREFKWRLIFKEYQHFLHQLGINPANIKSLRGNNFTLKQIPSVNDTIYHLIAANFVEVITGEVSEGINPMLSATAILRKDSVSEMEFTNHIKTIQDILTHSSENVINATGYKSQDKITWGAPFIVNQKTNEFIGLNLMDLDGQTKPQNQKDSDIPMMGEEAFPNPFPIISVPIAVNLFSSMSGVFNKHPSVFVEYRKHVKGTLEEKESSKSHFFDLFKLFGELLKINPKLIRLYPKLASMFVDALKLQEEERCFKKDNQTRWQNRNRHLKEIIRQGANATTPLQPEYEIISRKKYVKEYLKEKLTATTSTLSPR